MTRITEHQEIENEQNSNSAVQGQGYWGGRVCRKGSVSFSQRRRPTYRMELWLGKKSEVGSEGDDIAGIFEFVSKSNSPLTHDRYGREG